jgi:hypothetical protein
MLPADPTYVFGLRDGDHGRSEYVPKYDPHVKEFNGEISAYAAIILSQIKSLAPDLL